MVIEDLNISYRRTVTCKLYTMVGVDAAPLCISRSRETLAAGEVVSEDDSSKNRKRTTTVLCIGETREIFCISEQLWTKVWYKPNYHADS